MNALAMSLLLFVLQSQAPNPAAPLVGTWSVSAPAPLPGSTAPFGPQSFTIALESGKVMVTMGREAAVEADVYVAPRPFFTEQVALTVTQTANGGTRVYLIRATGGARAEVDMLITPADSTRMRARTIAATRHLRFLT
jgi:hypothetical protein